MATIIDFTPSAVDIKSYIDAAGEKAIAPPLQPLDAIVGSVGSRRTAAKKMYSGAPDILFVADYYIDNKPGCLIVWEDYYKSTHYELFRRNRLQANSSWDRILFLNATSLAQETKNFKPYIEQTLGLPMKQNGYYAVLDRNISRDAIYEYKVAAGFYPSNADIDYELIFQSKERSKWIDINNTDTVFSLSGRIYSTQDLAWVISLFNSRCLLFGTAAASNSVKSTINSSSVAVPKDLNEVAKAFSESVHFFGLRNTIRNALDRMADSNNQTEFFNEVMNAINESKSTLSYTSLNNRLITRSPAYAEAIQITLDNKLNDSPLLVPQYQDQTSFDSVADLTLLFERLRSIFTAYLYGTTHKVTYNSTIESRAAVAAATPTVKPAIRIGNDANTGIWSAQKLWSEEAFRAEKPEYAELYKKINSPYTPVYQPYGGIPNYDNERQMREASKLLYENAYNSWAKEKQDKYYADLRAKQGIK